MKKNYFFILFFLIIANSCDLIRIPSSLKKDFTICYSGKNTGLDTLINIHGYFRTTEERDRFGENHNTLHIVDTVYSYFMFFSDGVYLGLFSSRSKDLADFFDDVNECIKRKGRNCNFFRWYFWGYYTISGDTIIAQSINHVRSLNQLYSGVETKFIILDKNTLYIVERRRIGNNQSNRIALGYSKEKEDEQFYRVFGRQRVSSDTAKFVWLDEIPPSNCWLKKRRLFFCQ